MRGYFISVVYLLIFIQCFLFLLYVRIHPRRRADGMFSAITNKCKKIDQYFLLVIGHSSDNQQVVMFGWVDYHQLTWRDQPCNALRTPLVGRMILMELFVHHMEVWLPPSPKEISILWYSSDGSEHLICRTGYPAETEIAYQACVLKELH